MSVIRIAAMCTPLLVLLVATPSPVRADAWGCSYEKCVDYCTKVSGKICTSYCTRKLQEKRNAKICK